MFQVTQGFRSKGNPYGNSALSLLARPRGSATSSARVCTLLALVASSSQCSLALSQLFASSLHLSPVACCTLEKLKAAVKEGFTGSKAAADPARSCYACSTLGHASVKNKSCPLSMQTHRFMPNANLTWGPQKCSMDSRKPSPVCSPTNSYVGASKTPFCSYKSPLVISFALQNHRALLLLGGTQPKQQRHLVTWDFHFELLAKAGMSHQHWRDSPGWGVSDTGWGSPASMGCMRLFNILFILRNCVSGF